MILEYAAQGEMFKLLQKKIRFSEAEAANVGIRGFVWAADLLRWCKPAQLTICPVCPSQHTV